MEEAICFQGWEIHTCRKHRIKPSDLFHVLVIPSKVNLRLEKIQIDFLRGDGALEKRPHLFNWNLVLLGKKDGGVKLCNLYVLNNALLGKWNWKFVTESDPLWK